MIKKLTSLFHHEFKDIKEYNKTNSTLDKVDYILTTNFIYGINDLEVNNEV